MSIVDKSAYERLLDELQMNAVLSGGYKNHLISLAQQIAKEAYDNGVETQKNKENVDKS